MLLIYEQNYFLFSIIIIIYISVYLILKYEKNESGRYNPAQPSECRGPATWADSVTTVVCQPTL